MEVVMCLPSERGLQVFLSTVERAIIAGDRASAMRLISNMTARVVIANADASGKDSLNENAGVSAKHSLNCVCVCAACSFSRFLTRVESGWTHALLDAMGPGGPEVSEGLPPGVPFPKGVGSCAFWLRARRSGVFACRALKDRQAARAEPSWERRRGLDC